MNDLQRAAWVVIAVTLSVGCDSSAEVFDEPETDGGRDAAIATDAASALDGGRDAATPDAGGDAGEPDAGVEPGLLLAWSEAALPFPVEEYPRGTCRFPQRPVAVHDDEGGVFVACVGAEGVFVQRVLADGTLGWSAPILALAGDVSIAGTPGFEGTLYARPSSDGPLLVATVDFEARLQRLARDGTLATTDGVATGMDVGRLYADDLDGTWLVGSASTGVLHAARVDSTPSVVTGPLELADTFHAVRAARDGSGGLYVLYQSTYRSGVGGPLMLTRLHDDGSLWSTPVTVTTTARDFADVHLVSDATGVWAAWTSVAPLTTEAVWVARYLSDGTLMGSAMELSRGGRPVPPVLVGDGSGRAWVFVTSSVHTVFALNPDGAVTSTTWAPERTALIHDAVVDRSTGDLILLTESHYQGLYAQRVAPDGTPRIAGLGVTILEPSADGYLSVPSKYLVPLTDGAHAVVYVTEDGGWRAQVERIELTGGSGT